MISKLGDRMSSAMVLIPRSHRRASIEEIPVCVCAGPMSFITRDAIVTFNIEIKYEWIDRLCLRSRQSYIVLLLILRFVVIHEQYVLPIYLLNACYIRICRTNLEWLS